MRYLIAVRLKYSFQDICYPEEHVHSRSMSILLWAKRRHDVGEAKSMARQSTSTPSTRLTCESPRHQIHLGEW